MYTYILCKMYIYIYKYICIFTDVTPKGASTQTGAKNICLFGSRAACVGLLLGKNLPGATSNGQRDLLHYKHIMDIKQFHVKPSDLKQLCGSRPLEAKDCSCGRYNCLCESCR